MAGEGGGGAEELCGGGGYLCKGTRGRFSTLGVQSDVGKSRRWSGGGVLLLRKLQKKLTNQMKMSLGIGNHREQVFHKERARVPTANRRLPR